MDWFNPLQPIFSSHRNQSVDLQSKSTDWFLCDENIGLVKPDKFHAIIMSCDKKRKQI